MVRFTVLEQRPDLQAELFGLDVVLEIDKPDRLGSGSLRTVESDWTLLDMAR